MKENKGFTMIELMVVIAIIAVLTALAIPAYMKFAAKTRRSEVKYNLEGIYKAEVSWYAEHAAFDNSFEVIRWNPEGMCAYSYSVGMEVLGKNPPDNRPVGAPGASSTGFAAYGWGNLDDDPAVDVWHIDEQNNLVNDVDDLKS